MAAFLVSWTAAVSFTGIALLVATLRAPRRVPFVLLLCPLLLVPIASFGWGAAAYASGTAVLWTCGMPEDHERLIDLETRCAWQSSGCERDGSEIFWQPAHNLAVRSLTRLLGPMPGSYDGLVPDPGEVLETARRPYGWLSEPEAACRWRALVEAELPALPCRLCSSVKKRLRVVEVDDRGLLLADRHAAHLYDRRTGRLFRSYDLGPPSPRRCGGVLYDSPRW